MKTGQNTPLSQCEETEAKSYSQELLPSPVPLGKEHTPTPWNTGMQGLSQQTNPEGRQTSETTAHT